MDEFEYKGFKYRIVSVVDATVELISAGKLTGKIVVPEEVEYQNQKCKVVAIRGAKKTEYYDYQPDDKRRKVERRSREVTYPVFVGQSLQSFQDKLEVVLPKSLKEIGDYAFYNCYNLVSVNIPDSVTSIGEYAFDGCTSLTSITIPNSVISIRKSAFRRCKSLTSITIPNSLTSIGEYAFYGCDALTSINVDVNNPNYCSIDGVLFDKNQTTLIKYPRGKQGASYIIPNSVTSIGECAFYGCDALTSVTIPNSVTSIGNSAFRDCCALSSITIPNSVTSIGNSAFSGCDALTSITIPNSVTSIGHSAFKDCKKLTSITIPDSVTSIGDSAFSRCDKLTSVTIPNSVRSIGEYAFSFCNKLASVTIENEEGKVAIGMSALPSEDKISYVGKPKEQPAKPAEKEIAQAKPESPKATTQANPSLLAKLLKIVKSIFHSTNKK